MKASRESGNVMFLILIAVALFAALTYAVTKSERATGEGASKDAAELRATQLITGLNSYTATIQRLMMFGPPENISFENQVWRTYDDSDFLFPPGSFPNCTREACQMFHPQGGGIVPLVLDPDFRAHTFDTPAGGDPEIGAPYIAMVEVRGIGTAMPELVAIYDNIDIAVCRQVNKRLQRDNAAQLPIETIAGLTLFDGTMPQTATAIVGDDDPILYGNHSFAFKRDAADQWCSVLHVLLAR